MASDSPLGNGAKRAAGWQRRLRSSHGHNANALSSQGTRDREGSVHDILWSTGMKGLDVVDQLVGQGLDGLGACPRDMRREDKVRQIDKLHERMICRRRLDGRNVEGRSRDLP